MATNGVNFGGDLQVKIASTLNSGDNSSASTPTPATTPATETPSSAVTNVEPAQPAEKAPDPFAYKGAGATAEPEKAASDGTSDVVEDEFEFDDEKPAQAEKGAGEAKPAVKAGVEAKASDAADAAKVAEDENKPWAKMLPKEVENQFLKTARGRRMLAQFHAAQELDKPVEEGGLGFAPTVNQIKEFATAHSDLQMMSHEFHSGNPEYAANFITQWFGPDEKGNISPGAITAARVFLPTLLKLNPALGSDVAREGVAAYMEELYERAATSEDKDERVLWFNIARNVEKDITGKFREIPESLWKEGKRPTPAPSEVDQKLQKINQFERNQAANANKQFINVLDTNIGQLVNADITSALAKVKEIVPESIFKSVQKDFHSEVVSRVQRSPNFRQFVIARDAARSSRQMADVQSAAKIWRDIARPIIKHLRAQYLSDAGESKIAQSNARHATLEEASQKRGISAVSQPTEKNLSNGPATRQPNESFDDFIQRRTRSVMTQ